MPRLTGHADGNTYIHASAISHEDGYEDVTPHMLIVWTAAGALTPVTRAEWAAAMGATTSLDGDPDAPAQYPGPSGPENVYRWDDVVAAETRRRQTRRRRGGRPRGRTRRADGEA